MDQKTIPILSLREKLTQAGIPEDQHDFNSLVRMLPMHLDESCEGLSVDAVAEAIVILIGKSIIKPPSPHAKKMSSV